MFEDFTLGTTEVSCHRLNEERDDEPPVSPKHVVARPGTAVAAATAAPTVTHSPSSVLVEKSASSDEAPASRSTTTSPASISIDADPFFDNMDLEDFEPSRLPSPICKRLKRQGDSQFHNDPANASRIRDAAGDMISTGTQRDVGLHEAPLPMGIPSSSSSSAGPNPHPHVITRQEDTRPLVVDPAVMTMGPMEVDEGYGSVEGEVARDPDRERLFDGAAAPRFRFANGPLGYQRVGSPTHHDATQRATASSQLIKKRVRIRKRKRPGPTNQPIPASRGTGPAED